MNVVAAGGGGVGGEIGVIIVAEGGVVSARCAT